MAQRESPTPGDFAELVKSDFKLINEDMNEDIIEKMDILGYKSYIKDKIRKAAFEELNKMKSEHSKVKNIIYNSYKCQPYLNSHMFSNDEASLLFSLRSHTVRGIQTNFSSMYGGNVDCPLRCDEGVRDSQQHLLQCPVLLAAVSVEEVEMAQSVRIENMYGCLEDQKAVVVILEKL